MNVYRNLVLMASVLLVMAGCGSPGAPAPPSAELPSLPQDLKVVRKGNKVSLSWSPAARTTDGQNVRLKKLGPTLVCRGINESLMAKCVQIVGQTAPVVPPLPAKGEKKAPPAPPATYTDTLPADLQQMYPAGFATYAVQAMNWRWRTAGLSNQVRIPLAPVLAPPPKPGSELDAAGITLTFECALPASYPPELVYKCRVYRKVQNGEPAVIQDILRDQGPCVPDASRAAKCRVQDHGFAWEETYTYWVTPVTEVLQNGRKIAEVEGEDSAPVTIFAHDVFPPSVPAGLEAVASGIGQKPFIDLTWIPDIDSDLGGYNVYRQDQGGAWQKINQGLVTTPAFRDRAVAAGSSYTYSVTAVDVRGNESQRGEPVSEQLP